MELGSQECPILSAHVMKVSFSIQDIDELFAELGQTAGSVIFPEKYEQLIKWPSRICEGWIKRCSLRPGLELCMQTATFQEPFILETKYMSEMPYSFGFCVSGNVRGMLKGLKGGLHFGPGQNIIGFASHTKGTLQYSAEQPIIFVSVTIEPEIFNSLVDGQTEQMPTQFQRMIDGKDQSPCVQTRQMLSAMKKVVQQVLTCPYQGVTKRLYLESKTLELIAYSLHQASESQEQPLQQPPLKPAEAERIRWAEKILLDNLSNPPSLAALAKQVELNEYKLKVGFRQVLGTTAFACLREHRMQQAKQLLMTRPLSVVEVARTVGYASETSFSAAFKERFGMSPSTYRGSIL